MGVDGGRNGRQRSRRQGTATAEEAGDGRMEQEVGAGRVEEEAGDVRRRRRK
jgi:hypothetical protein